MSHRHQDSFRRTHRSPIDVEVTEIGSEPHDGPVETSGRRGLFIGLGIPWISFRAFLGQGGRFGLTAEFKVDVRLLPGLTVPPPWGGTEPGRGRASRR